MKNGRTVRFQINERRANENGEGIRHSLDNATSTKSSPLPAGHADHQSSTTPRATNTHHVQEMPEKPMTPALLFCRSCGKRIDGNLENDERCPECHTRFLVGQETISDSLGVPVSVLRQQPRVPRRPPPRGPNRRRHLQRDRQEVGGQAVLVAWRDERHSILQALDSASSSTPSKPDGHPCGLGVRPDGTR